MVTVQVSEAQRVQQRNDEAVAALRRELDAATAASAAMVCVAAGLCEV
jgi:hypothetical protein